MYIALLLLGLLGFTFLALRLYRIHIRHSIAKQAGESLRDEAFIKPETSERERFECGHEGPHTFTYHIYGESLQACAGSKAPPGATQAQEMCPECMLADIVKKVVRCSLCGMPIFPGQVVSLVNPFDPSAHTVWHNESAICCLRSDCDASNPSGRWTGEGVEDFFKVTEPHSA